MELMVVGGAGENDWLWIAKDSSHHMESLQLMSAIFTTEGVLLSQK